MPSDDVYYFFNNFIMSNDIKVLGKLLHRFEFFQKVQDLPGDIVELGVFKGSGVATFTKFLEIYHPNSTKKVIGFDLFNANNDVMSTFKNGDTMSTVYNKVNQEDLQIENVQTNLDKMTIEKSKYRLVCGDVCETTKNFVKENPGFRASLIYVDLDLDEPTYHSLMNLWDILIPGGYIVFDEYEYHKFDESNGVDKFIRDKKLEYNVKSTNWMAPTSYMIKK